MVSVHVGHGMCAAIHVCRAWHEGVERPFLLDNLWDLSHLLDYLVTRPDVDTQRIGITGEHIHVCLCAWVRACVCVYV